MKLRHLLLTLTILANGSATVPAVANDVPRELKPWLRPQSWQRDTGGPILSLGEPGQFDDTHIFAPAVIREGDRYLLWYCGVYLMWYGSYWKARTGTTATGFAVSLDGLTWYKHPDNPVLRPDPDRAWESHYVTSQSVMWMPDGRFRIWYASRKKPPQVNKYFALNTAVWNPADNAPAQETDASLSAANAGLEEFRNWRDRQSRRHSGQWCDRHCIKLERLYGTELHQRGATLPDLDLHPTPREKLSCLKPDELGSPQFTVEGWLRQIERNQAAP